MAGGGGLSMQGAAERGVWKQLDELLRFGNAGTRTDAELIGRFIARRDKEAEAAFGALVERYGPMVMGVCRRVLGDRHQADDAFQATFLVLARKASSIAQRELLASWLYGVACRTALDARATDRRRRTRELLVAAVPDVRLVEPADDEESSRQELRAILDAEVSRLPDRYRVAIVLCELDGLPRRAAALRLGICEGTLASRVARAKNLLRDRLVRRGVALSASLLSAVFAREAQARPILVPFFLADSTARAATAMAAGAPLPEIVSSSVVFLTQGVLKTMLIQKFKVITLALAAAAALTTGAVVLAQSDAPRSAQSDSADEQRLNALERKLDRLLRALEASREADSGRIDPPPGGAVPAQPAQAPQPAQPPQRAQRRQSSALPQPSQPPIAVQAQPVAPIAPPPPPVASAAPAAAAAPAPERLAAGEPFAPPFPPVAPPPPVAAAVAPGGSGGVESRMSALERRLDMLERRIRALEDRGAQNSPSSSPAAAPARGPSSS